MPFKSTLKAAVATAICATGAPVLARRLQRRQLTILMYHGVEAEPLSPPCPYVHDATSLSRELRYVRRHFHVLPLEEALERLYAGSLPDRAAAITFDDGTRNLLTHAAPVLRDLGLPAAVFLATGPMGTDQTLWPDRVWLAFAQTRISDIDLTDFGLGTRSLRSTADRGHACVEVVECLKAKPDSERIAHVESIVAMLNPEREEDPGPFRMLTWPEAHALADGSGVTLYPHSVTHPILSRCSDEKVRHEIVASCAVLERETGRAPSVFAYPNGGDDDFDDRAKTALRDQGVRWALATTSGLATPASDPLVVPRIGIASGLPFPSFRLVVSGALTWPRAITQFVYGSSARRHSAATDTSGAARSPAQPSEHAS